MIICKCKGVSYLDIVNSVRFKNARIFEDVQRITSASTGCGRCQRKVTLIIQEEVDKIKKEDS